MQNDPRQFLFLLMVRWGEVSYGEEKGRGGSIQTHPGEYVFLISFGCGSFSDAEKADDGIDGDGILYDGRKNRRDSRGGGRFVVIVRVVIAVAAAKGGER